MAEEIFDVVDEQDRVIGQAPRSEVHRRGLLHRAVHVFVFNTRGELLLQLRSATKDEFPLCYTSSASGHVGSGEGYEESAVRELAEELGLASPLEFLVKLPAAPELANEHTVLYRTVTDEPPTFHPEEIAAGEFYTFAAITTWVAREPQRFSPPLRVLLEWYRRHTEREP